MTTTDTSGWTPIGSTATCECFSLAPRLVVMVPHDGTRDTAITARENIAWQDAWWTKLGHQGCVVVFMDPIVEQEAGARDVYAEETGRALTLGYALIGGTFWGRAIAAVFMGLKKPPIPTRFFSSLDDALPWIDTMNSAPRSPA
jgi:hypothetical protein